MNLTEHSSFLYTRMWIMMYVRQFIALGIIVAWWSCCMAYLDPGWACSGYPQPLQFILFHFGGFVFSESNLVRIWYKITNFRSYYVRSTSTQLDTYCNVSV